MNGIGPGDEVVCIDTSADPWGRPVPLKMGALYVIEEIFFLPHLTNEMEPALCFALEGVAPSREPVTGDLIAWGAHRFRALGLPPEPAKAERELVDA